MSAPFYESMILTTTALYSLEGIVRCLRSFHADYPSPKATALRGCFLTL